RRWSASVRAIVIICSAMARTHKQMRLFEPAHRTSEMRAIDRENLKFFPGEPPHPTRDVRRRAIPGSGVWIAIGCQSRLIFRKIFQSSEHNPRLRRDIAAEAGEDIPDHGNSQQGCGYHIERGADAKQETTAGDSCRRHSSQLRFIRGHDGSPLYSGSLYYRSKIRNPNIEIRNERGSGVCFRSPGFRFRVSDLRSLWRAET